jgi:hypothetical protein
MVQKPALAYTELHAAMAMSGFMIGIAMTSFELGNIDSL